MTNNPDTQPMVTEALERALSALDDAAEVCYLDRDDHVTKIVGYAEAIEIFEAMRGELALLADSNAWYSQAQLEEIARHHAQQTARSAETALIRESDPSWLSDALKERRDNAVQSADPHPGYAPCPTCHQYSHSIGDDALAKAFNHFQAMTDHRGDGIPTQHVFDEATRDAAQVLMAAARSADGGREVNDILEQVDMWGNCNCDGFSIGHEPECNRRIVGKEWRVKADALSRKRAAELLAALTPPTDEPIQDGKP